MKSSISYQGKITIKVKNKPKKKIKNEGTLELFSSLCNILACRKYSNDVLLKIVRDASPSYMSIVRASSNMLTKLKQDQNFTAYKNDCVVSSNNGCLTIQENPVIDSAGSVTFTVTVSRNQLVSDNATSYYLLLISGNYKILAFAQFSADALTSVKEDANSQGIIEWNMSFDNKEDKEEG